MDNQLTADFPQYRKARELEKFLGDPSTSGSAISFRETVDYDDRAEYPERPAAALSAWRFHDWYVPEQFGGRLTSFEEMIALSRAVFRRDATLGVAYGATTMMGAINVWVAGSQAQKQSLADRICAGEKVSVAFHEASHGNDVLAYDVQATQTADGWLLDGEKWLINNATGSAALTVFARTREAGGPRGFSLFIVEKSQLAPGSFTYLPKVDTHGIRGVDVSGIRFTDAKLDADTLIGEPGEALELALKSFQITRALLPGMSLGAIDTALRTTLDFAVDRKLYGNSVFSIPHARSLLAKAFADLIVCDCLAVTAARGLHVTTAQMSVSAAVVKYLLPTIAERIIKDTAVVLGARYYLRQDHCHGIFEKILRDYPIAGLGHAGKLVCLHTIAAQLPQLMPATAITRVPPAGLFDLSLPLPSFDAAQLMLSNRGVDDVLASFDVSHAALASLIGQVDPIVLAALDALSVELAAARTELSLAAALLPAGAAARMEPAAFDLAERYCRLYAAACALQLWLVNRDRLRGLFAAGHWLVVGLGKLAAALGRPTAIPDAIIDALASELALAHQSQQAFSIVPIELN